MKNFYLFLLFSFMCVNNLKAQVSNSQPADITKFLSFKNDNFNMGEILYGNPVEFTVEINNISKDVIVLENVMVSCGCTTPKYSKSQSILPGARTSLILGFNGIVTGNFSKTATIFFSGGLTKSITFYGVGKQ
jgi:hypothetical protein